SLYTTRTFGSGGQASVMLSAWNVDSLEFRVYRINDPLEFFQQLPDPHQFGGRVPRRAGELTLIERIHEWKRSLRAGIRRSLRAQFSESPSEQLGLNGRQAEAGKPSGPGHSETHYAEAPLLNSQQLVLSFQQPVKGHSRWERETVNLGLKDKGFYLVEAVRGQLCAYSLVMISDIVMVSKPGQDKIFNFVVDRRTGQPIAGAKVALLTRDSRISEAETNADGVVQIPYGDKKVENYRLVVRHDNDFAVNTADSQQTAMRDDWMGYTYTDRPVYRP